MASSSYDAIVVGARCAGAPTAMLLARKGYKVLLVDRATFPSDTISTHLIHPPGAAALERWGLLNQLAKTGCPPIDTYRFDFGSFALSGSPRTPDLPPSYAPRRTVLDKLLVDAAAKAGAEVREAFRVSDLVVEEGRVTGIRGHSRQGSEVSESARIVVGADGLNSTVARAAHAEQYNEKPRLLAAYYSYWSGVPMENRFETYIRPARGIASWPTNDNLTLVIAGWPYAEFEEKKNDVEGNFLATLENAPEFAQRVRAGKREERIEGLAVPNYFRRPFGPGWALVGDAGYNKDFITAQGISDAFRDAESCVNALDSVFRGERSFDDAMSEYQRSRDEHVTPMYEMTAQLATLEPPNPQMQEVFAAMVGNQEAIDGFMRVNAGVIPPPAFFNRENVERILAAAG